MNEENQTEGQKMAVAPSPAPKTSILSIASFLLSILGVLTCVTAPIGIILGIIALIQIGRNPHKPHAQDLAAASIFIGIIAILLFPALPCRYWIRPDPHRSSCKSNLKQIGTAINMYTQDWNDYYPTTGTPWPDALIPYLKNTRVLVCIEMESKDPTYAMNMLLKGLKEDDIAMPDKTVLAFESIPGKNLFGGPELFPSPPRHKEGHTILFADGHVEQVPVSRLNTLNWWPKYKEPGYKSRKEN